MFREFLGMNTYLKGIVRSYNSEGEVRSGEIEVEGRTKPVHFDFTDGLGFREIRGGFLVWSEDRVMRDPKIGARVLLELDGNEGTLKAKPWGFTSEAEAIQGRIEKNDQEHSKDRVLN